MGGLPLDDAGLVQRAVDCDGVGCACFLGGRATGGGVFEYAGNGARCHGRRLVAQQPVAFVHAVGIDVIFVAGAVQGAGTGRFEEK